MFIQQWVLHLSAVNFNRQFTTSTVKVTWSKANRNKEQDKHHAPVRVTWVTGTKVKRWYVCLYVCLFVNLIVSFYLHNIHVWLSTFKRWSAPVTLWQWPSPCETRVTPPLTWCFTNMSCLICFHWCRGMAVSHAIRLCVHRPHTRGHVWVPHFSIIRMQNLTRVYVIVWHCNSSFNLIKACGILQREILRSIEKKAGAMRFCRQYIFGIKRTAHMWNLCIWL